MNPNLSTSYAAAQIERQLLTAQIDRRMLAEQAAETRSRRPMFATARQRLGSLLVGAGERLQGMPHAAATAGPAVQVDSAPVLH